MRPHLEHAAPVWAGITGDWNNLERVQNQCLKKILGAHSCSASNAVEVVSGIMPLRYRTRELCTREYFKIMSREENDEIKSLLMSAKVIKNKFTPLSFLVNVSKNVEKKIKDIECSLAPEIKVQPLDLIKQCAPTKKSLVKGIGSSKNRSTEQKAIGKEAIENFVSEHKGQNIMVFTDGSVKNRDSEGMPQTLGYGACASILIPVEIGRDVIPSNKHVGLITNNVECEVAGIELALNQIVQYIKDISIDCYNKEIFIFCDSAIDIVCLIG